MVLSGTAATRCTDRDGEGRVADADHGPIGESGSAVDLAAVDPDAGGRPEIDDRPHFPPATIAPGLEQGVQRGDTRIAGERHVGDAVATEEHLAPGDAVPAAQTEPALG